MAAWYHEVITRISRFVHARLRHKFVLPARSRANRCEASRYWGNVRFRPSRNTDLTLIYFFSLRLSLCHAPSFTLIWMPSIVRSKNSAMRRCAECRLPSVVGPKIGAWWHRVLMRPDAAECARRCRWRMRGEAAHICASCPRATQNIAPCRGG